MAVLIPTEEIAEKMFNAYNSDGPNAWKTFDGREVPAWVSLNDSVRSKWTAAARIAAIEIAKVILGEQKR